ncbi:MAG: hypothetical protein ABSA47_06980 [Verrucomicrobiota bacterium]|jgi:hypothetical protein
MRKTTVILLCAAGLCAASLIAVRSTNPKNVKSPGPPALDSAATNHVQKFLTTADFGPVFDLDIAATNHVRWGEMTNGLQMGISVEPTFGAVHCWLRNGETNEIAYSNYLLSDWESIGLEIREGANWVGLSRAPARWRGYEGIGPSIGEICRLQPHEVILPPPAGRNGSFFAQRRFGEWVTNKAGGGHLSNPTPPVASSRGATFFVDLLDFDWPDKVLHPGACEMRISHSFAVSNSDDSSFFAVYSPVFSLDGAVVKGLLDQLPRAVTNKIE